MFDSEQSAELYDLLYQDRKDYAAESARVHAMIRKHKPDATSLLDVGCGTGIHLSSFAGIFGDVAGVELSETMLERAARRLPGIPLHLGDMRTFDLGRRFDAVVSLFSAVGYVSTAEDLTSAIVAMSRHLADDGVLVIEPWYFPDTFIPGYVSTHALKDGDQGRGIARVGHSTLEGNRTRIEIHYLLCDTEKGIEHHTDVDRLTLFSRAEYAEAFRAGGLRMEYLETDDRGPGFFVGSRIQHG
ncbi:class I SAM-dependent methyltransferase [Streptomyces sp. CAU 1734]|uniref:class I SAM-dependent DNA methyltransferase n=1 Tax=Streptomyces sp. CAU 1734 TaxID=3140360 RepID=UPI003261CEC1